jgi:hypothetical protein
MLDALQFVKRGVARRDIVPGLQHFRIQGKRVTGFNGEFSLSAPVDIGFDCAPHAGLFTQALNACDETILLKLEASSLLVRSGSFKISVPCIDLNDVPVSQPSGMVIPLHDSLLDALKALREFVSVDASRPWACGVLFSGQSAYATNNAILAEYWLGTPFPHIVNVPSAIIDEVLRVDEELSSLQLDDSSITFHYTDGRWIKSALLALNWPDISATFEKAWRPQSLKEIPDSWRIAAEKLSGFGEKREAKLYFRGTELSTTSQGAVNGGAVVEINGLPERGIYYTVYLNQMLAVAEAADFERYPDPVPFVGERLRGALLGLRE